MDLARFMTLADIAGWLSLSWDTVRTVVQRRLEKDYRRIGQGHEAGQIHDQSRERTRDFRVGFDKGGACSNSSPVVVFNHRGTLTLSTTGLSPMDTLRTVRQRYPCRRSF